MNLLSRSGIEKFLATSDLNHDQGRPSQYTDSLFAVILYAFSDCDGSLRNIEKQCLYDVRYIHLSSQQKFRKSTIANFINDVIVPNTDAIFAAVIREIAKEMNIDPLSEIFIDGTKFEANANKYRFQWKSDNKMEKLIGQVSVFMKDNDIPFSDNPSKPYSFEIGTALKYLDELLQSKGIELRVNRSIQAEGTFGIIKQDIGYDRFRRRGIEKVSAELMLVCLGANIRKYLRFIETGVLPKFWVAPDNLQPEVPRKISYVVRKGGKKKQKKQPNEIAKKRR